jgi:hypothetical protein
LTVASNPGGEARFADEVACERREGQRGSRGRSGEQLTTDGQDPLGVDVGADGAGRLFGWLSVVGIESFEVAARRGLLLDAGLQLLLLLGEGGELGRESLEPFRDLGVGDKGRVLDLVGKDLKLGEVAEASCERRRVSEVEQDEPTEATHY